MFPDGVKQGDALLSCFGSCAVNKCPFRGLFSANFLAFLLVNVCVKWLPSVKGYLVLAEFAEGANCILSLFLFKEDLIKLMILFA